MFWLGDQLTSYDACDGIHSALIGSMSGGLSGWTVNHADIGAFTMITRLPELTIPLRVRYTRDAQLNVRWLELCVFINAIFRSHAGLLPNSSSQLWDVDMVAHTKRMTELFRDLGQYRSFLFTEAETKGLPLVRHGMLVEPDDKSWFNQSKTLAKSSKCKGQQGYLGNEIGLFQFYFGDDVIVVPAMQEDVKSVYAYIPSGTWIHFWENKTVQGPDYAQWAAPLGQPVFFYRAAGQWASFFFNLQERWVRKPSVGIESATFV